MTDLLEHQIKTTNTICDALFQPRKQSTESRLEEAWHLAGRLELMLGKLKDEFTDANGNLAEAHDFAMQCYVDLSAHRRDVQKGVEL